MPRSVGLAIFVVVASSSAKPLVAVGPSRRVAVGPSRRVAVGPSDQGLSVVILAVFPGGFSLPEQPDWSSDVVSQGSGAHGG
jgi:hypothetical protein